MAEENWSQKQRKQIYLNYAADSMKENVYKYTQKWICVKSALRDDEDIPETKGNCSHWLWVSTEIQVPAAPAPAGDFHAHPSSLELSSLAWKLWNLFCKDRGGSGAPSAQSSALAPGNVSQIVLGHLARTRVHPGAKEASPFLCLHPARPFSSSDFSLAQDDTWTFSNHGPSRCVLFLYSSYLSFLLFFQVALFVAITWSFFPINILFQLLIPLFVTRVTHSAPSHSNLMTFR